MTASLPGVRSYDIDTDRLRVHVLESGPEDGIPVVLVHGNLSTSRFYEHIMSGAPERYRFIAPDMRGFGRTERSGSTGPCTSPVGPRVGQPSWATPSSDRSPRSR